MCGIGEEDKGWLFCSERSWSWPLPFYSRTFPIGALSLNKGAELK